MAVYIIMTIISMLFAGYAQNVKEVKSLDSTYRILGVMAFYHLLLCRHSVIRSEQTGRSIMIIFIQSRQEARNLRNRCSIC